MVSASRKRNVRPSASPSGARIRASVSLTTATRRRRPHPSARSRGLAGSAAATRRSSPVDAGVVRLALPRAERDRVDRAAEHQRQAAGVGDRAHARRRRQALAHRRVERRAGARCRSPRLPVRTPSSRRRPDRSPGSTRRAAIDGPDEQARRDQQHQREGELAGDEHAAEARAPPARPGALGLQPIGDVAPRALQRRHQPEHQAGGERQPRRRTRARAGRGDLERHRHRRRQRQPLQRAGRRATPPRSRRSRRARTAPAPR